MLKNENQFILELCKLESAQKERLVEMMKAHMDYPYILGHLLYNRVGGVAYETLRRNELLSGVNREFRNALKAAYEHNLQKTDSFLKSLAMLNRGCSEFDFPYAFLKGAYLVDLYPKGLRTSNDIDILIEPENIMLLTYHLKSAGFRQGNIRNETFVPAGRMEIISSRMNRGETVPFVKTVDLPGMKYLEIDVNFSLGFKPGVDERIVHTFLKRTKPLIQNAIQTLDHTDFLLHLCAHLYKEATVMSWVEMGRDISLYKYCDIALFVDRFLNEKSCTEIIQRICAVGLEKECYYTLLHTRELFSLENLRLNQILQTIRPGDCSFMTQIIEPQTGKIYAYDMNYTDWVFCSNRKGELHEIRNA